MNPSRRFAIALFLVTFAAGAAVYLYDVIQPGISPAEKAYHSGWQGMMTVSILTRDLPGNEAPTAAKPEYVADFRKAFELNPKEVRYQLSLVQALSADRSALESLLKDTHLLPRARAMAECDLTRLDPPIPGYIQKLTPSQSAQMEDAIRRLETVKRLDPRNGVPCYSQAQYYFSLGREREGALAVREGNSRSFLREYWYVDPCFSGTLLASAFESSLRFPVFARRRELARCVIVYANRLSRQRNVNEAMRVLEDTTSLGLRQASEYPRSSKSFLVGVACSRIGERSLGSMYKDFGKLREYERLKAREKALRAGCERISARVKSSDFWLQMYHGRKSPMILANLFAFAITGASAMAVLVLIALICWLVAWILRRRAGQEPFVLPVWRPGRLERLSLIVLLPLAALCVAGVLVLGYISPGDSFLDLIAAVEIVPEVAACLPAFLILLASLIILRREYSAREGKIGLLHFLFRMPASISAWRSRQVAGALATALLFFIWMGLIVVIIHRPLLGGYPWQPERVNYGIDNGEAKLVTEILKTIPR